MKHDGDRSADKAGGRAKTDPRQDRLKLALRENLKRRKSQARGRNDVADPSFGRDDGSPHDGSATKPRP